MWNHQVVQQADASIGSIALPLIGNVDVAVWSAVVQIALHHHFAEVGGSFLHDDVAYVARLAVQHLCIIAHATDAYLQMLPGGGNHEVAVFVAHAAADGGRVAHVEQGDVGVCDGALSFVYDSSDEFEFGLEHGFDEDEAVALHFHADGIEADTFADGFGNREAVEAFCHLVVFQFVVDKGYFVLAGRFSQVDEHFCQRLAFVVAAHRLRAGREHGKA